MMPLQRWICWIFSFGLLGLVCCINAAAHGPCTTIVNGDPNPANPDTSRPCAAGLKQSLWYDRDTLRVRFLNGTPQQQSFVQQTASQWNNLGNIKFEFVNSSNAEIRVAFQWQGDATSWSNLGRESLKVPAGQPTMNFGWLDAAVVLHEFGHALGLVHEHLRPDNGIPWNEEEAYKHYLNKNPKWTKATVKFNVFETLDENSLNSSAFDKHSIMAYPIPKTITDGVFEIPWNTTLSPTDKAFLKVLYPLNITNNNLTVRLARIDCLKSETIFGPDKIYVKLICSDGKSQLPPARHRLNAGDVVDPQLQLQTLQGNTLTVQLWDDDSLDPDDLVFDWSVPINGAGTLNQEQVRGTPLNGSESRYRVTLSVQ
jgi:serralysin